MNGKKRLGILVLTTIICASSGAQSVGGGLSMWVPESLYLGRGGSAGVESALGTSVSMGNILSFPIGIAYNKVYGLLPEGSAAGANAAPWAFADTMVGFVMVKARFPIGPLYADVFGGGAGLWNMTLTPLTANIAASIGGGAPTVFATPLTVDGGRFGWGWQAGAGFGVNIGPVAVDLNVTYRLLRAPATISGGYYTVDIAGPSASGPVSFGPEAISFRLAGFSVGIDAAFQM